MSGLFSPRAWSKIWVYRGTFLLGLLNTLKTAAIALLIALTLGIVFGLMATSGKKILKAISRIYIEVIQNTPVLLQMCFLYYALAFSGHSPGIIVTGFLALGIYTGAYMAEVIRAGIESVPKGQFEAAQAQGFGYVGQMYYIIIPQSIKVILPPMTNVIVNMVKNRGKRALLCAPTGRASKRMMEATGEEAKTIHRLLGMDGSGRECDFNESTPLPVDVLIVDEISMADIYIFNTLLKAIPLGARLVLVGDKDQLPSVACGNILSDVIDSKVINVVYLTEVYRQDAFSTIVSNAHRINRGEMPVTKDAKDFFFSTKSDVKGIQTDVLSMIKTRIPSFLNVASSDIQVLSPIKKSEVGVEVLNTLLQEELNPSGAEFKKKDTVFRQGDRVMQTVNNYQLEWTKTNSYESHGTGVFNGDIGVVAIVERERLQVEFDDGRRVWYDMSAVDELTLAYCISVHKSQGSEFPVVILVLGRSSPLLLTRNLVYTAVTRAKRMVVIIGEENVLRGAINNTYTAKRYSLLRHLILKNKGKAEMLWGDD